MKFVSRLPFALPFQNLFFWIASAVGTHSESLLEAVANFSGPRVGAAVKPLDSVADAAYANKLRQQLVPSPEYATRPAPSTYGWMDADAIASSDRAGGQQMRGHTLMWHNSIPNTHPYCSVGWTKFKCVREYSSLHPTCIQRQNCRGQSSDSNINQRQPPNQFVKTKRNHLIHSSR
jgi:GH35 family endo-1,4-beta-xylanase